MSRRPPTPWFLLAVCIYLGSTIADIWGRGHGRGLVLALVVLAATFVEWRADRRHKPFKPDWRVAPGETLQEWMELRGYDEAEVARRCGIPQPAVRSLLLGLARIGPPTAEALERGTGISAGFWLGAEANYRKP